MRHIQDSLTVVYKFYRVNILNNFIKIGLLQIKETEWIFLSKMHTKRIGVDTETSVTAP